MDAQVGCALYSVRHDKHPVVCFPPSSPLPFQVMGDAKAADVDTRLYAFQNLELILDVVVCALRVLDGVRGSPMHATASVQHPNAQLPGP
jgi:hypothetical protein